jgi:1-acyl-sn-glycerol-3-phosphate acyltransferase
VFYWVVKAVLGPMLRIVFRPWADGIDNVPRTGAAVIASNHLSFSDHFFTPLPLSRKVVFLAKSEYFTGRGIKGLVSRVFMSGMGEIPVDRSGGEASERALRTGLRVLAEGQLLGIYPEGTRAPDGRLYRGKTGVARLALEARVPVVPCAMVGTFEFQPPGRIIPRLQIRPGVRFGKPLDFSRYYGLETDRIVLRAVTDEIMYEIMKLAGQEYVDTYAQRSKTARPLALRNHLHRHDPPAGPSAAEPGSPIRAGTASGTSTASGTGTTSGTAPAPGTSPAAGTAPAPGTRPEAGAAPAPGTRPEAGAAPAPATSPAAGAAPGTGPVTAAGTEAPPTGVGNDRP